MKRNAFAAGILVLATCGGCTHVLRPRYTPSEGLVRGCAGGARVALRVIDRRGEKIFGRADGFVYAEQGSWYSLDRPSRDILEEGLRSAMSICGYRLDDSSPVTFQVSLKKFEGVWHSGLNVPVTATSTLEVQILGSGGAWGSREFSETVTRRASGGGMGALPVLEKTLTLCLTGAVEKAVQNHELIAAATTGRPLPGPSYPPALPPPDVGPVAQRWAVVIGISKYGKPTKRMPSLKYAHRDAEELAAFLKSKAGGEFAADHVKLLTDEQATATKIRDALFTFLKKTTKEDLVVLFFAGHGLPDPDKPSNLYFVAHDSDPANIAATGIPMWDIATALKRTVAAQRVVVLIDACHSAGATEGIRGVKIGDQFNAYFDALAKARPGRVIFTSSEGYEVSREGKKWGGGHGVFTWALLEGLRGKADRDKNGIVTLGEALDYVDITVRRETANEQHPTKAGVRFDRNLPLGVVK